MTLNIIGVDEDPTYPSDQFWTAAAHLLIQIARVQPKIGQAVDAVIDTTVATSRSLRIIKQTGSR